MNLTNPARLWRTPGEMLLVVVGLLLAFAVDAWLHVMIAPGQPVRGKCARCCLY